MPHKKLQSDETCLISALVAYLHPAIKASLIGLHTLYSGSTEKSPLVNIAVISEASARKW